MVEFYAKVIFIDDMLFLCFFFENRNVKPNRIEKNFCSYNFGDYYAFNFMRKFILPEKLSKLSEQVHY